MDEGELRQAMGRRNNSHPAKESLPVTALDERRQCRDQQQGERDQDELLSPTLQRRLPR